MKLILICALVAIILGCQRVDYDKVVTRQYTTKVEAIDIDPPKHFKVHLKSIDGIINETITSKHCSDWENIQVGTIYEIEVFKVSKFRDGKLVSEHYSLPSACTFAKYAKVVKYPGVI